MTYDELEIERLRSHERHMKYIYGLRWGGLALSAITIIAGAVMLFAGLQGSFTWAFEAPKTITAKLTNASPGIVFATIGMVLGFIVILQEPVNYSTRRDDGTMYLGETLGVDPAPFLERSPSRKRRGRRPSTIAR